MQRVRLLEHIAVHRCTRSARFAVDSSLRIVDSFRRVCLNSGANIAGSDLFSGASSRTVASPASSAIIRILSSKTVLPTPRRPTINTLLAGRPSRDRLTATSAFFNNSSRPASCGGGAPAPGENGFSIGRNSNYRLFMEFMQIRYKSIISV